MNNFEKFIKKRLKAQNIPFKDTTSLKDFCDFIAVLNNKVLFLELKEYYSDFNFKSYQRRQADQYNTLIKFPKQTVFMVLCDDCFIYSYNSKKELLFRRPKRNFNMLDLFKKM